MPNDHYFDDFQIVDVAAAGSSGQDVVFEIHRQVGDGIAAGAPRPYISAPAIELAKRKPMASSNVGLGVNVDLSAAHTEGTVTFMPTANRIQHILDMWAKAKRTNSMTSGEASTLRGKRSFLLESAQGRVGRASSLSLIQREHQDGDDTLFSEALEHAYAFDAALLPNLPPRVELKSRRQQSARYWSTQTPCSGRASASAETAITKPASSASGRPNLCPSLESSFTTRIATRTTLPTTPGSSAAATTDTLSTPAQHRQTRLSLRSSG